MTAWGKRKDNDQAYIKKPKKTLTGVIGSTKPSSGRTYLSTRTFNPSKSDIKNPELGTWEYWWNNIVPINVKIRWLEKEKNKIGFKAPPEVPAWKKHEIEEQKIRDEIDTLGDAHANWKQIEEKGLSGWMANHIWKDGASNFFFSNKKNYKKVKPDTGEWEGHLLD